jgi:phosphoribulokinase
MTTLTYYSPKIIKITNLFKHTNVGISFKNTNTLQQLKKPKIHNNIQEQDKSGIYELICNTCHMSYIGEMSRSLKQRYQEHTRHIKHNEPQLACVLHILNDKHKYDPLNNTLTLLKHIDETTLLLPYEQLYIQSYHHHKQLIPEQHTGKHDPIHQLIYNPHNTP